MSGPCECLVLHVGMHKTGSSSIQHRLAAAASPDFHYVDLGRSPNHSGGMFAAFSSEPERYHFFRRQGIAAEQARAVGDEVRHRLAAELSTEGPGLRIVSGEDITTIDPEGLATLRDFLAPLSRETRVFAYARAPRSFMESAFQQRVRGGMGALNFASLYPMYRKRFLRLEEVFGRHRVQLAPFDAARFPDRDVVADFCGRFGLDVPAGPRLELNRAHSRRATALLFTYRRFAGYGTGPDEIRGNKALVQALGSLEGPKLHFGGAQVDEVLARFANDRRWVERRLRVPLEDSPAPAAAVTCEDDLFRFDEAQLEWLRQWADHPRLRPGMGPEDVAAVVRAALPAIVEQFRAAKRVVRQAGAGA